MFCTLMWLKLSFYNVFWAGDTRILCRWFFFFSSIWVFIGSSVSYSFNFRPIDCPKKEGCKLSCIDGSWRLELQKSKTLPITIIDSGKVNHLNYFFFFFIILLFFIQLRILIWETFLLQCLHADADEWTRKLERQQEKAPSKIDLLDERDCRELNIDGVRTFKELEVKLITESNVFYINILYRNYQFLCVLGELPRSRLLQLSDLHPSHLLHRQRSWNRSMLLVWRAKKWSW